MYDGRPVKSILLSTGIRVINSAEKENGTALILEYKYCGDRDEYWVKQLNKNGDEISRYNAKYIIEINWIVI